MSQLAYSVVIATYERPDDLRTTLESPSAQTRLPSQVVVVDSAPDQRSEAVVAEMATRLPLHYERAR